METYILPFVGKRPPQAQSWQTYPPPNVGGYGRRLGVVWFVARLAHDRSNITALISFSIHFGEDVADPTVDVAMLLVPGFGSDIHLLKAFTFIALNIFHARCGDHGGDLIVGTLLALMSVASLFAPLVLVFRDELDASASTYERLFFHLTHISNTISHPHVPADYLLCFFAIYSPLWAGTHQ